MVEKNESLAHNKILTMQNLHSGNKESMHVRQP